MISTHRIVQTIQNSCFHISKLIRDTNSLELSTATNQTNQSAETVKQLDEFANSHLLQSLHNLPEIRMIGSEEESELISVNPQGRYLVCFDPLDGSSNIDVNITIGTIFAIYEYPSSENSLTCGNQIVSAGYCLYGSSTQFVIANREQGVSIFQLQEGVFEEIRTNYFMPEKGTIVSHNQSNAISYLDPRIQCFIDELIVEKCYSSRYVGSLVADAHRTLINMIKKYIESEQSLILIVTEANRDAETAQALELAKHYDPEEERSIRILTKFDMFDSEESELRAKQLVESVDDLSPHAIICRPRGEEYSSNDEAAILSKFELPEERSGVKSLHDRLPKLLCKLIRTNMPFLKKQVKQVLKDNRRNLREIGNEAPDNTTILLQIQKILHEQAFEVSKQLTKPMTQFRETLHNSQNIINKELVDEYYLHDAFQCTFFQGETTFNKILALMVNNWQKSINKLIMDVKLVLKDLFDFSILKHIKQGLLNCISNNWEEYRHNLMDKLKQSLQEELIKEQKFKTMNHYLTSKYKENITLPTKLLDTIINLIDKDTFYKSTSHKESCEENLSDDEDDCLDISDETVKVVRKNIRTLIENALKNDSEKFNQQSIEEQQKRRILAASKANWSVSHKNLTDNVLSIMQQIILDGINHWTTRMLIENNEIKRNTGEDNRVRNKRNKYKKNIQIMEKCLSILNTSSCNSESS